MSYADVLDDEALAERSRQPKTSPLRASRGPRDGSPETGVLALDTIRGASPSIGVPASFRVSSPETGVLALDTIRGASPSIGVPASFRVCGAVAHPASRWKRPESFAIRGPPRPARKKRDP